MSLKSLPFIEDYLELIAGFTVKLNVAVPAGTEIRLARYDVNVTESLAVQALNGKPLTDRQGELAHKIVIKYRRQLLAYGLDVSDHITNPKFRLPLRTVDRSRRIYIDNGNLVLKFAYEKNLITAITADAKMSQGRFKFDRDDKLWILDLSEYNVSWAVAFGQANQFEIAPEVSQLMKLITECEQTEYRIQLEPTDQGITITNAESSLYQYIEDNLGGVHADNLLSLVDNSALLGYTVHPSILQSLEQQHRPITVDLIQNFHGHWTRHDPYDDGAVMLETMVEYATLTRRWPIYIYEPDASNRLRDTARAMFAPKDFYDTTDKKFTKTIDFAGARCVYLNKLKRTWEHRIPLLISTHAMLHGSEKQHMLQQAEKVIYYTGSTFGGAKTIAG